MMELHPLIRMLGESAGGRFPTADGRVEVTPAVSGQVDAIVAFTRHVVIATRVGPEEIRERVAAADLEAPMGARFVGWLESRLGAESGPVDMVLAHDGGGEAPLLMVRRGDLAHHPRVVRAGRFRTDISVYSDDERRGLVVIGRGLGDRWEMALEVDPRHRGRGLAPKLILSGVAQIPLGELVFGQVAPGNVASVRAVLAAGFSPVAAEMLFLIQGTAPISGR
jgi:GNAT superfamily N-acetyltransferase